MDGSPVTVVTSQGPAITLAPSGMTTVFAGSTYTVKPFTTAALAVSGALPSKSAEAA